MGCTSWAMMFVHIGLRCQTPSSILLLPLPFFGSRHRSLQNWPLTDSFALALKRQQACSRQLRLYQDLLLQLLTLTYQSLELWPIYFTFRSGYAQCLFHETERGPLHPPHICLPKAKVFRQRDLSRVWKPTDFWPSVHGVTDTSSWEKMGQEWRQEGTDSVDRCLENWVVPFLLLHHIWQSYSERAWRRGLEFALYKLVTGISKLFCIAVKLHAQHVYL